MFYESDYYILEYSNKDLNYIDELNEYITSNITKILEFFDIKDFESKINIKLFDDLENFRKEINNLTNKDVPLWLCGFSFYKDQQDNIYILSLDNYRKTYGHEKDELIDLKKLIIHEIVHACHRKYSENLNIPTWLKEGLAAYLSGQDKYINKEFNANCDQLLNGNTSYHNYLIMLNYALNKYNKEYILGLLKNKDNAVKETFKLYEEIKCSKERNFKDESRSIR